MKKLPLVFLAAIGAAFWLGRSSDVLPSIQRPSEGKSVPASEPPKPSPAGPAAGDSGPVPVVAGQAQKRDVPIFLNGIGSVQGFNSVNIRSRVDGQLEKLLFQEGQDVRAGQLLARVDPRPFQAALDQALAKKKQDEALLANARLDLKRDLTLLAEKAGTAQKADTQKALVAQLEATLQADDAAIEAASVQLSYTQLLSPIDGRTGIRLVDEGNVVRAADPTGIVTVTQMRPISIVFTLPERHLAAIQSGTAQGPLQVLALGRDNQTPLAEGTLSVIDNQIDSTTGTIRMKATFPNEALSLWPGQFVNVRLRVGTHSGVTVVPAPVVQRGPSGAYGYAIQSDGTAEMRPLKVASIEDGVAVVEEGFQPGEQVVVDGQFRLRPGAKVKPTDPPAGGRSKVAGHGSAKTSP